jgi:hypothetical protein
VFVCLETVEARSPDGRRRDLYLSQGQPRSGNESGWVHVYRMADRPRIREEMRAGNGRPAPDLLADDGRRTSYFVTPRPIPRDLRYRRIRPTPRARFGGYHNYGTPARGFPYSNLAWSWVNVSGGGVVRTFVREGEVFYRTAVAPIRLRTVDDIGWVEALHGYVFQGGRRFYGWKAFRHRRRRANIVEHLAPRHL